MSSNFRHNLIAGVAALGAVSTAFAPSVVQAQTGGDEKKEPNYDSGYELEEIVITGTFIRGSEGAVGSNLISVGRDSMEAVGAVTSNELLASIPQITNLFNTVPNTRFSIAVNQIQIARPNIRNLSNDNSSSASTLVLMDGHRIAAAGVTQASPDPDLIPTGAIERVEVLLDGGSSTYGADAVGGVINFISRKRFDGVQVGAQYGVADGTSSTAADAIGGKDWDSGSAYVAYSFTKDNPLYGRDRDFIVHKDWATGIPGDLQCNQSNLTVGGVTYSGATLAPGINRCDLSDDRSVTADVERHGVLASLYQTLNDAMALDVKSFYSQRETLSTAPLTANGVAITSANPYYQSLNGTTSNQSASLSFAPAMGNKGAESATKIKEWGANAELKADITSNWQSRTLLNYSQTDSTSSIVGFNPSALTAAGASSLLATALNPYNVALTNPQLLANLANNWAFAGQTKNSLMNVRTLAEGRLFNLPGGELRLAGGYEYAGEELKQRVGTNIAIGRLGSSAFTTYARHVNSAFAELQIPVFGKDNALPGVESLTLSAAGRYDHYSDFGNTTNPKFGLTYKPIEWITLRGNWNKAFNAPTPLDQLGGLTNRIQQFPFVAFLKPGDPVQPGAITVALLGSTVPLQPQTAKSWSAGFDLTPPVAPGLRVSMNYYNVEFTDILGTPSPSATLIYANFPNVVTTAPSGQGLTPEQLRAFAQLAPNGPAVIDPIITAGTKVYQTIDFRTSNFGVRKVSGIDLTLGYTLPMSFGGLDASFNGNRMLKRDEQLSPIAPTIDFLQYDTPVLLAQTTIGANITDLNLRAQVIWNYSGGYDVQRAANLPQDQVASFSTVDLFFKYDTDFDGILKNLSFTFNVKNVLDKDPPTYKLSTGDGYRNAFTMGREFIFGVRTKFL